MPKYQVVGLQFVLPPAPNVRPVVRLRVRPPGWSTTYTVVLKTYTWCPVYHDFVTAAPRRRTKVVVYEPVYYHVADKTSAELIDALVAAAPTCASVSPE